MNGIKKSEIRKDYLINKYVIITPGRAKRPKDTKEQTIITRNNPCPFCLENINKENIIDKIQIKDSDKWNVLCIKNIFPAVTLDNKDAYGTQEVIIENPEHEKELADLSEIEIENVLKMYIKRTKEIAKNKKIEYILCFKNQGPKAGASIIHAHSQVFATNILPPVIQNEQLIVNKYKSKYKTCPYCDIINKEAESERLIFEDQNIVSFTPYASEFHYESWIFPKRHLDNITKLNKEEIKSLAIVLKKILIKLKGLDLSFNLFMDQVISNKDQHFYIKIQPRDSIWAGVELGSGLVINSVPPEVAAQYYRE